MKVIVITGAAGGLGAALARRFARDAGHALVLADIRQADARAAAARLDDQPAPVLAVPCDVSDADAVAALARAAVDRFGRLDVMINNAGVLSPNGRIHNIGDDDWRRAIDVNLMGTVHGIRAAVPVMRAQGGGRIINTASVAGMTAWSHTGPYGATKAAIIHLTRIAAVEYARDGITVNCVCPGTFRSAIHDDLPPSALAAMADRHPLGLGAADDVVGAFAYLAGDEAGWVTGSSLVVDGGYSSP